MNQHRPTGSPVPGPRNDAVGPRPQDGPDLARPDVLAERVAAALRSREPEAADTALTAERIAARVAAAADSPNVVTPFVRRARRIAVTGLVTSTVVVVGTGAAATAHPYTTFAVVVEGAAHAVGLPWTAMPDGYTREQYNAFWGAGFTGADQTALEDLWDLESTETKARAGQLILDGEQLPFEPGTHADPPEPTAEERAAADAFIRAGYTPEDVDELSDLWNTGFVETKVRAGEMLLDGETLPLD